jgi:hypothetical protein
MAGIHREMIATPIALPSIADTTLHGPSVPFA